MHLLQLAIFASVLIATKASLLPSTIVDLSKLNTTEQTKNFKVFANTKKVWMDALKECRQSGMELASVNSPDDEEYLYNAIHSAGLSKEQVWTSGVRLDGFWVWMSYDWNFSTYHNWDQSQPDGENKNEHCIGIQDVGQGLKWQDFSCWTEMYVICEK